MIYRLDKKENRIVPCHETDFKSVGILEHQHIEKWNEDFPAILGEELLVITTEYDRFDETSERLDILALDTDGNVVIVELKRDDSGKHADLQAIKYAAYCSTLRLTDVCQLHQEYLRKRGACLIMSRLEKGSWRLLRMKSSKRSMTGRVLFLWPGNLDPKLPPQSCGCESLT